MANEISVTMSLEYAKGGISSIGRSNSFSVTPSGTRYIQGGQNVGTSAEAIDVGDIAAGGVIYIENLGPTNFVQIMSGSDQDPLIKLKVGQSCIFPVDPSAALYAKADTAAVDIEYQLTPG